MTPAEQEYRRALLRFCREVRLDYFPQAEAGELLRRVVTLEDVYLPLSMVPVEDPYHVPAAPERGTRFVLLSNKFRRHRYYRLQALPGGGKTTFCKRLAAALLEQDRDWLRPYDPKANHYYDRGRPVYLGPFFSPDALPVWISCKYISGLTAEELRQEEFPSLLARLCLCDPIFSALSRSDLTSVLKNTSSALLLILDGWDELLDLERADLFSAALDRWLNSRRHVDLLISTRPGYRPPRLSMPCSQLYEFSPLSAPDIRAFCSKWARLTREDGGDELCLAPIAEQIIASRDPNIRLMRDNPLDLSLLLTIVRDSGQLPANRADLFRQLVDLSLSWCRAKHDGPLTARDMRILLSYIAAAMSRNTQVYCGRAQLSEYIRACLGDLGHAFSHDLSSLTPDQIAAELSHTGLFSASMDLQGTVRYSFSSSAQVGFHRTTQDYLTACAILMQYGDRRWNSMHPAEILEDKYLQPFWLGTILFLLQMNNGRVRRSITRSILQQAQSQPVQGPEADSADPDHVSYKTLLTSLTIYGAQFREEDFFQVCDYIRRCTCLEETDPLLTHFLQPDGPSQLYFSDFSNYVAQQFSASRGRTCPIAQAALRIREDLSLGLSPLDSALDLLRSGQDDSSVRLGCAILQTIARCAYFDDPLPAFLIHPAGRFYKSLIPGLPGLTELVKGFSMSEEWLSVLGDLLASGRCGVSVHMAAQTAVVAGFASMEELFASYDWRTREKALSGIPEPPSFNWDWDDPEAEKLWFTLTHSPAVEKISIRTLAALEAGSAGPSGAGLLIRNWGLLTF